MLLFTVRYFDLINRPCSARHFGAVKLNRVAHGWSLDGDVEKKLKAPDPIPSILPLSRSAVSSASAFGSGD